MKIGEVSKKYDVSVPQLSIKYDLQLGFLSLPRSTKKDHIKQNVDVDFEIEQEDVDKLLEIHILIF